VVEWWWWWWWLAGPNRRRISPLPIHPPRNVRSRLRCDPVMCYREMNWFLYLVFILTCLRNLHCEDECFDWL
jgi:hypothetical protein